MNGISINYLAVVVAALIHMGVGFAWYSPILFLKPWMKLIGNPKPEDMQKSSGRAIAGAVGASVVMAYVLAHIVKYILIASVQTSGAANSVVVGLQSGLWLWLGFVATTSITTVLFEKRPFKLYALSVGYELVSLLLMGVAIAVLG